MRGGNGNGANWDHCFIVGCPRSGTTALTRLLHAHTEVVIGMERYKTLLHALAQRSALHEFGPPMFEPRRFLDFRPGDTNVRGDSDRFRRHYELAAERFSHGALRWVGDKVPHDEDIVLALQAQFPRSRFVFIFRDLVAVANSYWRRAMNPDDRWPADATSATAVAHWYGAFRSADALLSAAGDERVLVVRYETLFAGSRVAFDRLFGWLDVELAAAPTDYFETQTASWCERAARPLTIDGDERASLEARVDTATLDRFRALSDN